VRIYAWGSFFRLVSVFDSLVAELEAHKRLFVRREDFFWEKLDYSGITIEIWGGFQLILKKRGGGVSKKNLLKKKKINK
jgi:hypothetical protein